MPKFLPYLPIKPFVINAVNPWAILDPKDYSQFGFDRHNGVDTAIGGDALVRAPFDGIIVRTGNQPEGGGIFCGLLSDQQYDFDAFTSKSPDGKVFSFPAATCYVLMDFLHMERLDVGENQRVKAGDVLGVQDNTGFSTGPHTHIQPRREHLVPAEPSTPPSYRYLNGQMLVDVDKNDANNTFDPTPFWNGTYASEIQLLIQASAAVLAASDAVKDVQASNAISPSHKLTLLDFIKKVVQELESLL